MAPKHLDDLFDWLQLAAHRIVRPGLEEALGCTLVAIAPELGEVLLDAPRSTGFQVELVQGPKRDGLGATSIRVPFQPSPLAASQGRGSGLGQLAVFLLSDSIDCLTEILGDVELVVHDVSLGHALPGGTHVRRPHVHGHRLDRCALCRRERLQQACSRLKFPLGHQVQYPRAANVGQDAGIGVPPLGALLVDTQVGNLLLGTPQHASLYSADHDRVYRAPGQPREFAYGLSGGAGLKQLNDEPGHHVGHSAVALGPRHRQLLNRAVAVFELGHPGLDKGFKLTGIKMTPLTFAPTIDVRPFGGIRRVCPYLPFLQHNLDNHALVCQRKVNLLDRPRRLQTKKLLVQRGVFHIASGNFEKSDCPAASKKLLWN